MNDRISPHSPTLPTHPTRDIQGSRLMAVLLAALLPFSLLNLACAGADDDDGWDGGDDTPSLVGDDDDVQEDDDDTDVQLGDDDGGWDDDGDGYTQAEGDCDDGDASVYPGAEEVCDGADNDCNDAVDENDRDDDGDGVSLCDGDCDDADGTIHPGAMDGCDGVDSDCDGLVDEDGIPSTWFADADGDGFGDPRTSATQCVPPDGFVANDADCDDLESTINPEAAELCGDGIDNNCDGISPTCSGRVPVSLEMVDLTLMGEHSASLAGYAMDTIVGGEGQDPSLVIGAPGDDAAGEGAGAVYLVSELVYATSSLSSAEVKINGIRGGDHAGFSMATQGDLNADGVPDLVIGAPGNDDGMTDGGAVYVFFGPIGTPDSASQADVTCLGIEAGAQAGFALSVGDLNGDGLDDLSIGAPWSDANGIDAGSVFVILGPLVSGALIPMDLADRTYHGENEDSLAGYAIDTLVDHTGDGVADLVFGAPHDSTMAKYSGAVTVVPSEDPEGPSDGWIKILGTTQEGLAGYAIDSLAGYSIDTLWAGSPAPELRSSESGVDLGGSGLLVGVPQDNQGGEHAGAVYLFSGDLTGVGSVADAVASWVGEAPQWLAGYAIDTIVASESGDVMLAIGAPQASEGGPDAGAVYLIDQLASGENLLADASIKVLGTAGIRLGAQVGLASDLDGNGFEELMLGAPGLEGGSYPGSAHLMMGPLTGSQTLSVALAEAHIPIPADSPFDTVVAAAGDLNGDGVQDLAIGFPDDSTNGAQAGVIRLFYGPFSGEIRLEDADGVLLGTAYSNLGQVINPAGDVDGDGKDDLLLGIPYDDEGGANAGAVYLIPGPAAGEAKARDVATIRWLGTSSNSLTGRAVAQVGDVTGDDRVDIAIGAPNALWEEVQTGVVYLVDASVLGGQSLNQTQVRVVGAGAGFSTGFAVAAAGDVNGDGQPDLMVSSPGEVLEVGGLGSVSLFFGPLEDQEFTNAADLWLTSDAPDRVLGGVVAGVGDTDADGFGDIALGLPTDGVNGGDSGSIFLIPGGLEGSWSIEDAGILLLGEGTGHLAGSALSRAGDVNQDGFADLLIGAPGFDTVGSSAGAAYLVYGPVSQDRVLSSAEYRFEGIAGSQTGTTLAILPATELDPMTVVLGAPGAGDHFFFSEIW